MRKILLLLMGYCFITATFAQTPEQKIQSLGIVLPAPTNPVANYVKFVRTGNLIFLSGHGPANADGKYITGKLGKELSIEEGYNAAKLTGINLLSTLKAAVGDLSKVK